MLLVRKIPPLYNTEGLPQCINLIPLMQSPLIDFSISLNQASSNLSFWSRYILNWSLKARFFTSTPKPVVMIDLHHRLIGHPQCHRRKWIKSIFLLPYLLSQWMPPGCKRAKATTLIHTKHKYKNSHFCPYPTQINYQILASAKVLCCKKLGHSGLRATRIQLYQS